jgi:hypothetical protein
MDLELAALVCTEQEIAAHPWYAEYQRQVSSVARGQSPHVMGNGRRGFDDVRSPDEVALERVRSAMRADARSMQLKGLKRAAESMPF